MLKAGFKSYEIDDFRGSVFVGDEQKIDQDHSDFDLFVHVLIDEMILDGGDDYSLLYCPHEDSVYAAYLDVIKAMNAIMSEKSWRRPETLYMLQKYIRSAISRVAVERAERGILSLMLDKIIGAQKKRPVARSYKEEMSREQ